MKQKRISVSTVTFALIDLLNEEVREVNCQYRAVTDRLPLHMQNEALKVNTYKVSNTHTLKQPRNTLFQCNGSI